MQLSELSEILGNFGEFVAAIAVVITLGYLALQVRQNTRALQSSERTFQSNLEFGVR